MLLSYLLFAQDIDYVLWTGDVPAHNIWNQSRADEVHFQTNFLLGWGIFFTSYQQPMSPQ